MKNIILLHILTLFFTGISLAEPSNAELDNMSARLDEISMKLRNINLASSEKAALLYEKSEIMLTQMWPTGLRSGTESLLEAIRLEPSNEEYRAFLKEAYDQLWKDRDFSGDDKISTDLKVLRERVVAVMGSELGD